jgi:hypothetical protein
MTKPNTGKYFLIYFILYYQTSKNNLFFWNLFFKKKLFSNKRKDGPKPTTQILPKPVMIDPLLPFPKWVFPQNPFSASSFSPPFSSLVFLRPPLITAPRSTRAVHSKLFKITTETGQNTMTGLFQCRGDLSNTDCYNRQTSWQNNSGKNPALWMLAVFNCHGLES